jgi:hypothetical protein
VRHAVLGNAGSIVSFRVGVEDAPYLVREFQERFDEIDLLQLPNYSIYLKLMIDGTPSLPFSAVTLDPTALSSPQLKCVTYVTDVTTACCHVRWLRC